MIKELMHDPRFLSGRSEVATKEDLQVAQDLLDTLIVYRESCVGMAANMIGVRKRIIAFLDESVRAPTFTVMLNPEIIKKDGAYDAEEGCLSLLGGDHAGYLQPYDRHDADAGGGEYRPQDRRYGRTDARGKANTRGDGKTARKRAV